MSSSQVIEIDGGYQEGGGQILRIALSLSCILQKPIRVVNIRANRPKPGLSIQHMHVVNLLADICTARVSGNAVKSTSIEFHPGPIKAGLYKADTGTAASVALVQQAALPVLLFASQPSKLYIIGGTNVPMAPQVDYLTEVFRPNLEMFGATFDFELFRRGYYPKGGGECEVSVSPVAGLKAAQLLEFGQLTEICGWCYVAGKLPVRLSFDMKGALKQELRQYSQYLYIEAYKEDEKLARENASGVVLKATTSEGRVVGAAVLGEKTVDARDMGNKAARELLSYTEKELCIDAHIQDQLILFMALAEGESSFQTGILTKHTYSAINVAELMTGVKFDVEKVPGARTIVKCKGIGLKNTISQ